MLADTGYYNNTEVATCVERGLTPYVPKSDTSANTAQGLFGKSRFRFDAARDVYICPGNQQLTYRFSTDELGRSLRTTGPVAASNARSKPNAPATKPTAPSPAKRTNI